MKVTKKGVSTVCALKTYALVSFVFAFLFLPLCVQAGYIDIYENAVINNNLAENSIVRVHGSAHITVEATVYVNFELLDSSVATVFGGNASYQVFDAGVLNLYGGDFVTR
jgi:hypothetical protein